MRMPFRWLAVLAVLLVGGCGLSPNDDPQAIPAENLPPGLLDPNPSSSTTLPESGATTTITVFFLTRDGDVTRLAPAEREVKTSEAFMPGARLAALFAQPTSEEQDAGLTTSIPADTVLLRAPPPGEGEDVLVIDVSSEMFAVQGQELANAFAQIVWTVSEIEGVRDVRFMRDGVEISALDGEGAEQEGVVTKNDYRSLAPE
jgi:spore germination protein GerM